MGVVRSCLIQCKVSVNMLPGVLSNLPPVVFVVGATGTGKSKLGIELAKRFHGEVINADAMQLYKGLNIVTAKVSKEEMAGVPHHMLGVLDPLAEDYMISHFRDEVLPLISKLRRAGRVPIIVGGTNYYIESILWNILVDMKAESSGRESDESLVERLMSKPVGELYEMLLERDPERAVELHRNDKRKIVRSLQIFEKYRLRHSEYLLAQRSRAQGNPYGGELRFEPASCVMLWVQCDLETLDDRLDRRVDEMLKKGLLQELDDFHREYNRQRMEAFVESGKTPERQYTCGIFQAIGFKEFHEFLLLEERERDFEKGQILLKASIERMKGTTRRYARAQLKWIRNRFLHPTRPSPPVYGLDATDLELWDANVLGTATRVLESLVKGEESVDVSPVPRRESDEGDGRKQFYCAMCNCSVFGKHHFDNHLQSRKHRHRLKKIKQQELLLTLGYLQQKLAAEQIIKRRRDQSKSDGEQSDEETFDLKVVEDRIPFTPIEIDENNDREQKVSSL